MTSFLQPEHYKSITDVRVVSGEIQTYNFRESLLNVQSTNPSYGLINQSSLQSTLLEFKRSL